MRPAAALLAAAAAAAALPMAAAALPAYSHNVTDAGGLGRRFDGVGAISGGGATSRLLLDYPPAQRSDILDYLFKPQFGASLSILKVEIGGEADTTNGAEASHWPDGAPGGAVYDRGYEWALMVEARKRNPGIALYGLAWAWPSWVGNGTGNPWSNPDLPISYITSWLTGARDVYNLSVDYIGSWNEKSFSAEYLIRLRAALDAQGFNATRIVAADDGGWDVADAVQANATLAAALHALGSHYPGSRSSSTAQATGLQLWASEDNSVSALDGGAGGCFARVLNENFANGLLTATISWSLICSWYAGIQFYGDGLMVAVQPWSGNYQLGSPIWAAAHHAQAAWPGWRYLPHGAGSGYLAGGGTYTTRTPADLSELTIVVEKLDRAASQCSWSSSPANTTANETATFVLGGAFAALTQLNVWYSRFHGGSADPDSMFVQLAPLPVVAGAVTLTVNVGDVFTLTTVSNITKGAAATPPPPAAAFPLPYADDFEGVPLGQEGMYISDMNGVMVAVHSGDAAHGVVMQTVTPAKPILWLRDDTRPHSIVGDAGWTDVNASVAFALTTPGGTAALGVRCTGNVDTTEGVWLGVGADGVWNLTLSVAHMGNASAVVASGALPAPPALGSWHTLTLVPRGGSVSAWIDSAQVLTDFAVPASAPASGYVGLATVNYGDATMFDDIAVAALPYTCGAPVAGTNVTTQPCAGGSLPSARAWRWAAVPGAPHGAGHYALAATPSLCLSTFGANPQTGAPNVGVAACDASGQDAAQLWAPPPPGGAPGTITGGVPASQPCLEVTKNELQAGARLEVWACNGGSNQAWTWSAGAGTLTTGLDGQCVAACGGTGSAQ